MHILKSYYPYSVGWLFISVAFYLTHLIEQLSPQTQQAIGTVNYDSQLYVTPCCLAILVFIR